MKKFSQLLCTTVLLITVEKNCYSPLKEIQGSGKILYHHLSGFNQKSLKFIMHIWKALACLQTLFFFLKKIQQCSFIFSFAHPQPLVVFTHGFHFHTRKQTILLLKRENGRSVPPPPSTASNKIMEVRSARVTGLQSHFQVTKETY